MSGHTPGPWNITDICRRPLLVSAGGPHGSWRGMVASIDAGDYARSQEEGIANARLIAAAPQLLEALQALLENHVQLVSCGDCGNWNVETEPAVIAARAAIAAATGNT